MSTLFRALTLFLIIAVAISGTPWTASPASGDEDARAKIGGYLDFRVKLKQIVLARGGAAAHGELGLPAAELDAAGGPVDISKEKVFLHFPSRPTPAQLAELAGLGVVAYPETWLPPVGHHPTGYIMAEVPIDRLNEVAARAYVSRINSAVMPARALNDEGRRIMNVGDVWTAGYDGTGVRVAIIDSSLDTAHGDIPTPVAKKDYSNYPNLDDDVSGSASGHGTHVTATVLGRGNLSSTYKGVAPGADLVFFKIGGDTNSSSTYAAMAGAIRATAGASYNAKVVNLSYGGWSSYHDGSDEVSQAVDYVTSLGVTVFVSAGNENGNKHHFWGRVPANGTSPALPITVSGTKSKWIGPVEVKTNTALFFNLVWYDPPGQRADLALKYSGTSSMEWPPPVTSARTHSPRDMASQWFSPLALVQDGSYRVWVENPSSTEKVFHLYYSDVPNVPDYGGDVTFDVETSGYSITSPAEADGAIAVAASVGRSVWRNYKGDWKSFGETLNNIAGFSSRGPRADDGAPGKPNITAPGSVVISARDSIYTLGGSQDDMIIKTSGYNNGQPPADYLVMQGTSMASPMATGVGALLTQRNPSIKPAEIRHLLEASAGHVGSSWDSTWGWGRIDARAATQHATNLYTYADAAHAARKDAFNGNTTAYAFGNGFLPNHRYTVAYYNGLGNFAGSEAVTSTNTGTIASQKNLFTGDAAGLWKVIVHEPEFISSDRFFPGWSYTIVRWDFTYGQPPHLYTNAATAVGTSAATLNGNLDFMGSGSQAQVWFDYGLTTSYGQSTPHQTRTATGNFNAVLTGLAGGTTYHYRAKAQTEHGAAEGIDATFTTATSPPTVVTQPATDVTTSGATLNLELTSKGTAPRVGVSFDWGLTPTYGSTTYVLSLASPGTFFARVYDLPPATSYHHRARADGGTHGVALGEDATFTTTTAPPAVTTRPPMSIGTDRATLRGQLTSMGTATSVQASFQYGATTSYGSSSGAQNLSATGGFSKEVTGLMAATTYHYRARADAGTHGAAQGEDASFTTTATAPQVETMPATSVTANSATLNGVLTSLGTAPSVTVLIDWGLTTQYQGGEITVGTMTATGSFSTNVSGLAANTEYHFIAWADAGAHGWSQGADMTFKTGTTPPAVTTLAATNVTSGGATLNGNLTNLGTATSAYVSFDYGETSNYGIRRSGQNLSAPGAFSVDMTGYVRAATTYYYRARAEAAVHGVALGQGMTFTTLGTPPVVATTGASNITTTSALLRGSLNNMGSAGGVFVYLEYGITAAYGSNSPVQGRSTTGSFDIPVSGLAAGVLYHFRAKADGGIYGAANGADMTFTTATAPPSITTLAATAVGATLARLNGNLVSTGTAGSVAASFDYGLTVTYTASTSTDPMSAPGAFNALVTGLAPGTTYHYRARADGAHGNVLGQDLTFTTTVSPPAVSTGAAGSITTTSASLNGTLTSLGTASTASLAFDYGPTTSYGLITASQAMTATGSFSGPVSGLAPATSYHFRARAESTHGLAYGPDAVFTTAQPPTVTTGAATSITTTGATLNGNLAALGTATSVDVSFQYGLTRSYENTTSSQNRSAPGAFSSAVSGLVAGITYFYRAAADAGALGVYHGAEATVTAATTAPAVSTLAATDVTGTSAVLRGNLTSRGTAPIVNAWFEYGTTTAYGSNAPGQQMNATGTYFAYVGGLAAGTTYHYRAKADGAYGGVATGNDITFLTSPSADTPAVATLSASDVSTTAATLNGNLTDKGAAATVNVFFEWGATTAYGSTTPVQARTAAGTFSANLTNLALGANTYHFRARADGGAYGTSVGADMAFTTLLPQSIEVVTKAASSLTATGATLNGDLRSAGMGGTITVSFEWGTTTAYGNATTGQSMSSTGVYSAAISGLATGTTYHYRARAQTQFFETATGADVTFTTTAAPPSVTTSAASAITGNSATLNGNLTSKGSAATVNVSFEYGTTLAYGTATPAQPRTTTGAFNAPMSGLTAGTTYHFRARADGGVSGAATGSDLTFLTTPLAPVVATVPASGITNVAATLNGNLTSLGTAGTVGLSFEYGTSTAYGTSTPAVSRTAGGSFAYSAVGLTPGATYHYRARADGGVHGASNGADAVFTTLSSGPATVDVHGGNPVILQPGGSLAGIPVAIKNIPGLGTGNGIARFEVGLTWNKDVLRVTGVTPLAIAGWTVLTSSPDNTNGVLTIIGSTQSDYLSSNTIVANLAISAAGPAGSAAPLTVSSASLLDRTGNPVSASPVSAPVQVTSLQAETSLAEAVDPDGVVVVKVIINRIKDGTGATATIPGGIGSYSATASGSPPGGMEWLGVRETAPYLGPTINTTTGVFGVSGVASPTQPGNSTVARLVPKLTGNAATTHNLGVSFQQINAAQGSAGVPEEHPASLAFRRGNAKPDAVVDIFDAMFIAQAIVGNRPWSDISLLNAAGVKHDGASGDKIDIFDAMYIAQLVVGNRNGSFEPVTP